MIVKGVFKTHGVMRVCRSSLIQMDQFKNIKGDTIKSPSAFHKQGRRHSVEQRLMECFIWFLGIPEWSCYRGNAANKVVSYIKPNWKWILIT